MAILLLTTPFELFAADTTEFCLDGKFDVGATHQGLKPEAGQIYPTTWCITSEDDTRRVYSSVVGNSNADIESRFNVAYLPPDVVRIVDYQPGHDIEFNGIGDPDEARRARRADPRRLLEEFRDSPNGLGNVQVNVQNDRVITVKTTADLPYVGRAIITWLWDWEDEDEPVLHLNVDDVLLFSAKGRWRTLSDGEADALWEVAENTQVHGVPGEEWPSRVNMRLEKLADGVYMAEGVRSGFQHLVVDTAEGLVVADAPAGWVEFQHIPPTELVPGLGVSGLSEKFVDFLAVELPGRPIKAVALTHFHNDHAGGARAFAAAGADIYASAHSASFIERSLNQVPIPSDRLGSTAVKVIPVAESAVIGSEPSRVKLVSMGASPHSYDTLGVWALDKNIFFVSDVHMPSSDANAPSVERAPTECWFAAWASENLPPDVQVMNTHNATQSPVDRLERYLESDLCLGE